MYLYFDGQARALLESYSKWMLLYKSFKVWKRRTRDTYVSNNYEWQWMNIERDTRSNRPRALKRLYSDAHRDGRFIELFPF